MIPNRVFPDDERAPDGGRLVALERQIRTWNEVAQLTLVIALGSFPVVAAYHIDFEPALRLTLDLGSILWAALPVGALLFRLNAARLGWLRRRRLARPVAGQPAPGVIAAPPPFV